MHIKWLEEHGFEESRPGSDSWDNEPVTINKDGAEKWTAYTTSDYVGEVASVACDSPGKAVKSLLSKLDRIRDDIESLHSDVLSMLE